MPLLPRLRALLADREGLAAIELAFTLPVLTFLSLGAFDVSRMLSTQLDYQQAAAEVASLALARPPQSDTTYLKDAAMTASGLASDKVTVATSLTCNGTASNSSCTTGQEQARYVTVTLNGQYVPLWTHFGVNNTINLTISRKVRYQ
jgi:Flp pilus assembly protein TadG